MAKGQYPRTELTKLRTKLAHSERRVIATLVAHEEAKNENAAIRAEIAELEKKAK